jgi:hypothetical protein
MNRMIGDNMGFVLSPATQHAGITNEIWVCIDAPAMGTYCDAAERKTHDLTSSNRQLWV